MLPHQSKTDSYYPNKNCKNEALVINFSSQKTQEEKAQHPSTLFVLKKHPIQVWRVFFPLNMLGGIGNHLKFLAMLAQEVQSAGKV